MSYIADEVLYSLFLETRKNSDSLFDESEILFKSNKIARSYTLAHLSIEEYSKTVYILFKILDYKINRIKISINELKKLNTHTHKIKIFNILFDNFDTLEKFQKGDSEKISLLNKMKNLSIYCDFDYKSGNISTPSEIIDQKKCEEIRKLAKKFKDKVDFLKLNNELDFENLLQRETFVKTIKGLNGRSAEDLFSNFILEGL